MEYNIILHNMILYAMMYYDVTIWYCIYIDHTFLFEQRCCLLNSCKLGRIWRPTASLTMSLSSQGRLFSPIFTQNLRKISFLSNDKMATGRLVYIGGCCCCCCCYGDVYFLSRLVGTEEESSSVSFDDTSVSRMHQWRGQPDRGNEAVM